MALILAMPHSSAFLSPGVPVTREPTSSLNSVRYSNACESISPSPAIFTSAGFVPSSSGPFGAGLLSARSVCAPNPHRPSVTTATPVKTLRIHPLLAPLAHTNSTTHSDALLTNPFQAGLLSCYSGGPNRSSRLHRVRWLRALCEICVELSMCLSPARTPSVVPGEQRGLNSALYAFRLQPYTPNVGAIGLPGLQHHFLRTVAILCSFVALFPAAALPQQLPQTEKSEPKPSAEKAPENPAQIELLETRIRFEANGDSRKEVHARVHINNELGVRQFARLNFDYNRSFESVEIPLVHITHPSGGSADILPSAITDNPNPSASSASSPATLSNTASSPPFRTIPSPPTSGSIIPSIAPASSQKKSSNSTSQAT